MGNVVQFLALITLASALDPQFSEIKLIDSEGNNIPVTNLPTCYAQYYNYACKESDAHIAPLRYVFGAKPATFQHQHNCTQVPLSKQCCEYSSTDCTFESTKDIIEIWKNCGYKSDCPSSRGAWNSIRESNKDEHNCPESFIPSGGQLNTQYAYLRYACFPKKMDVMFDGGGGKGKVLSLHTKDKPYQTGIKLQCKINSNDGIQIQPIDIRLCVKSKGISQCDQELSISSDGKQIFSKKSGNLFGLEPSLGFKPGKGEMILTFINKTPSSQYHIWLYLTTSTGASDVSVNCEQPLIITTTTTTTTTTAIPTTTEVNQKTSVEASETTTKINPNATVKASKSLKQTTLSKQIVPESTSSSSPFTTGATTTINPTGSPPETSEQILIKNLIKYSEIVGAGLAGIFITSVICYCKTKHQRMKQKYNEETSSGQVDLNLKRYPRLVPVGAPSVANHSVAYTDPVIESCDSVSQVAERQRRRRMRKRPSAASVENVEEESSPTKVTLIQILCEKIEQQPEFAKEIMKHCGDDSDSTLKIGSEEFRNRLKTILETFPSETLKGTLNDIENPQDNFVNIEL